MKKLITAMGLVVLTAVSASANTAHMTISDNNGNSVSITDGGVGDGNAAAGAITFNGIIGNWNINVSTGIANPPAGGAPVTQPSIDLNSINNFNGGAGNVLTIQFWADGLGPIASGYSHTTGGTKDKSLTDVFSVIAGPTLTPLNFQTATTSPFAFTTTGLLLLAANQNLGLQAVLTATGAGLTSFDTNLSPVPDAGMTLALLGSALTGLALFARSRKTA